MIPLELAKKKRIDYKTKRKEVAPSTKRKKILGVQRSNKRSIRKQNKVGPIPMYLVGVIVL
jgi:cystathionine beta-lyase family protein involved in aluminum resistance